jgi:hypothetical protein
MADDTDVPTPNGGGPGPGAGTVPPLGILLTAVYLVVLTAIVVFSLWSAFPRCDNPPLSVTSIEPAALPISGGSLRIYGTGFEPGARVSIDDITLDAILVGRDELNATAPPHKAGGVRVAVVQGRTTLTVPQPLIYQADLVPKSEPPSASTDTTALKVDSVQPSRVSIVGGQAVTILGSGFRTPVRVLFDGIPARAVQSDGSRFLTATAPGHVPAVVDIVVADDRSVAKLAGAFTYVCPAVPDSRMLIVVLLAGALGGLVHALRSFFWYVGNRKLVWSWTPMYVLLPFTSASLAFVFFLLARAGLYQPQGEASLLLVGFAALVGMFSTQAAEKLKDVADGIFTKAAQGANHAAPVKAQTSVPPAISLDPASGPAAGGTNVTIKGTGFTPDTKVTFGGLDATAVKFVDAATVVATTPAHAAGPVDVTILVPQTPPIVRSPGFTYTGG